MTGALRWIPRPVNITAIPALLNMTYALAAESGSKDDGDMKMDATKIDIPVIEAPVKECKICDLMIGLGLASAVCQDLPPGEQGRCHQIMKPLEEKKASAADVLADLIVLTGDTNLNAVLDRTNLLIYSAMTKAKEKLIAMGKLTAEGFPIEGK